jgi:hypothetical protein
VGIMGVELHSPIFHNHPLGVCLWVHNVPERFGLGISFAVAVAVAVVGLVVEPSRTHHLFLRKQDLMAAPDPELSNNARLGDRYRDRDRDREVSGGAGYCKTLSFSPLFAIPGTRLGVFT